jgi:hypothetical protein
MVNATPKILKRETPKGGSQAGQRIRATVSQRSGRGFREILERPISVFRLPGMQRVRVRNS